MTTAILIVMAIVFGVAMSNGIPKRVDKFLEYIARNYLDRIFNGVSYFTLALCAVGLITMSDIVFAMLAGCVAIIFILLMWRAEYDD